MDIGILISILAGNLPDIKKQIEDNVVGLTDIILVATQFLEELKTATVVLQI